MPESFAEAKFQMALALASNPAVVAKHGTVIELSEAEAQKIGEAADLIVRSLRLSYRALP